MEFEYEFPEMQSENLYSDLVPHAIKFSLKEAKLKEKDFHSSA